VRVAYAAPASCPDEQMFVARVRARTQHGRFAAPQELARTFDVSLTDSTGDAHFAGQIAFVDLNGERAQRLVSGVTCDEVTSSLALIMALAIDDRVALAEAQANPASPSTQPAAPSAPPKENAPSPASNANAAPRAPLPRHPRLRWDVGANAGLATWDAPDVSFVYGAFIELGSRQPGWSARLSAFDTRQTKSVVGGSEHFATDFVRVEGCPVALSIASQIWLTPCAAFDSGLLSASGQGDSIRSTASKKLWAAGVLVLRLGWAFKERLIVGLDAELGVPLTRYDFQFLNPTRQLPTGPALGVGAKAGVGLRFP